MLQRKMLMSIASVLVLVALIAGATMAWFTDSETVAATFTAGTVNVGINDPTDIAIINPGDIIKFGELEDAGYYHNAPIERGMPQGGYDRVLQIDYTGSKAAYVRVLVDFDWAGDLSNANLSINAPTAGNWIYDGVDTQTGKHIFRLNGILNGSSENLGGFDLAAVKNVPFQLVINGANTGNQYQGVALNMNFEVQAVQAANVDPNAIPFESVVQPIPAP